MPTIFDIGGAGGGFFGFGGGFSAGAVTGIGGIVSDMFNADAMKLKAQGAETEAQEYGLAAGLADLNAEYTKESTAIKVWQEQRKEGLTIGQQGADIAANGFQMSGSGLDIMRDSVEQSALTRSVLGQQGLIQEKGYEEQAASYRLMQSAAETAAKADRTAAKGLGFDALIKGAAVIAGFL